MKNLIFVILITFSNLVFSQNLLDTIDFNQLNTHFINQQVIKKLNEERYILGFDSLVSDTISMFITKYHTDYIVKYNDESDIHRNEMVYNLYGNSVEVASIFDSPLNRFVSINYSMKRYNQNNQIKPSSFITEKTEFNNLGKNPLLTYDEIINLIFNKLKYSTEASELFTNKKQVRKRFGISNNFLVEGNNNIRFFYTYSISLE